MLTIIAEPRHLELWNEETNTFEVIDTKGAELKMEHSLISLAKWESKWKISLLHNLETRNLTVEQMDDYFKCMLLKPIDDPNIITYLPLDKKQAILNYMSDTMTAYKHKEPPRKEGAPKRRPKQEILTAEDFYYWMVDFGIDFQVQKWHINRLVALVEKCQDKQVVPKKMKKHDILASNYLENAKRLKKYNTTG